MGLNLRILYRSSILLLIMLGLGYSIGMSLNGYALHTYLGASLIFLAIAISIRKPVAVLYAVVVYLPFMGFIRRLLVPELGWSSFDPFVLLAPVTVLLLGSYWFYHYFVLRDIQMTDTRLFKWIRWLILIDLLEMVNPLQHGITVGLSGVIFYVVPLFWMVLSRFYFDLRIIRLIIVTVFVTGIILALYGLKQTYFGFYPFEQDWVKITGYVALYVGSKLRALSTPDNPQEYAVYLSMAIAVGWVYVLRGRPLTKVIGLLGISVMAFALFMESARGPIVLSTIAIAIASIMNARTARSRYVVSVIVSAIITVIFIQLGHIPATSTNPLISHQLQGLSHPLNQQDSSLVGHSQRMYGGIIDGIKMPIGRGLGSTTIAASKFNSVDVGTEVDISNTFLSDGIVGGVIYVLIILQSFLLALRNVKTEPKLALMMLGILIASIGQWLNGGLYSTSAITWIVIGCLDRMSQAPRAMDATMDALSAARVERASPR